MSANLKRERCINRERSINVYSSIENANNNANKQTKRSLKDVANRVSCRNKLAALPLLRLHSSSHLPQHPTFMHTITFVPLITFLFNLYHCCRVPSPNTYSKHDREYKGHSDFAAIPAIEYVSVQDHLGLCLVQGTLNGRRSTARDGVEPLGTMLALKATNCAASPTIGTSKLDALIYSTCI